MSKYVSIPIALPTMMRPRRLVLFAHPTEAWFPCQFLDLESVFMSIRFLCPLSASGVGAIANKEPTQPGGTWPGSVKTQRK